MAAKTISGAAGKMGRTYIDDVEFGNTEYEYTEIAEEEEVTNSTSQGFNEYDYGNKHIEGSMSLDWDVQQNPHDGPPAITAGEEYAFLGYIHSAATLDTPDGPFLSIDKMKINNVRTTVPAKGKVTWTFDFKSNGPYELPEGETATSSSGS